MYPKNWHRFVEGVILSTIKIAFSQLKSANGLKKSQQFNSA
jgi:hypothetical protein